MVYSRHTEFDSCHNCSMWREDCGWRSSRSDSVGTPAVLYLWVSVNLSTSPAYRFNALCGNFCVRSNDIRVMVVGSSTLSRIAKKLQDNALMDLEFYPEVERNMG